VRLIVDITGLLLIFAETKFLGLSRAGITVMKKNFLFGLILMAVASCSEYEVAGTGFINNTPSEFIVREATNGVKLEGYTLILNGEELGVLELDGKPTTKDSKITNQFKQLKTKYGVFDAVQTVNLHINTTMIFRITLDGKYVATISGNLY